MAATVWTPFSPPSKSTKPSQLGVFGKWLEIHHVLFYTWKYDRVTKHPYDSSPYTWLKPGMYFVSLLVSPRPAIGKEEHNKCCVRLERFKVEFFVCLLCAGWGRGLARQGGRSGHGNQRWPGKHGFIFYWVCHVIPPHLRFIRSAISLSLLDAASILDLSPCFVLTLFQEGNSLPTSPSPFYSYLHPLSLSLSSSHRPSLYFIPLLTCNGGFLCSDWPVLYHVNRSRVPSNKEIMTEHTQRERLKVVLQTLPQRVYILYSFRSLSLCSG